MLIKNSATDRDVKWTRNYVKRTGDTMTGRLDIKYGTSSPMLTISNSNITKGTAPASDTYSAVMFLDTSSNYAHDNGGRLSILEHHTTSEFNEIYIRAYKPDPTSSDSA